MKSPVVDIFETQALEMPVDVALPEKKVKVVSQKKEVPYPEERSAAYTIKAKTSLSEDEFHIFQVALEALESFKGDQDVTEYKLKLLDLLAKRFGFSSAREARAQNLSFNLKQNFEVELVEQRQSE